MQRGLNRAPLHQQCIIAGHVWRHWGPCALHHDGVVELAVVQVPAGHGAQTESVVRHACRRGRGVEKPVVVQVPAGHAAQTGKVGLGVHVGEAGVL